VDDTRYLEEDGKCLAIIKISTPRIDHMDVLGSKNRPVQPLAV
jgi:hypothetical protein